ncbi:tubulin-specific chaperone E [Cimex lectularius]|uniref:Tubulin-specific chaperone E n=1 Tax=Cimex lectularius TaxID=79782 RepID=A0A8I6SAN7_CIMLE|nr:tubulin-specific chaperone E [Cimex lectularius]XP_014259930.1 tubulin-specific chaperone E [Cimex lectularius]
MVVCGMENFCDVKVGSRIQVGDQRGTVLFVGPVPPTKGLWLGIDWDDPRRGKHDGVYDGVRYFQARYSTSGSLIRQEKVQQGQTIIQAIEERYGGPEQIMATEEKESIQRAFNAPLFEMVGFEKLSSENYETLTIIGVREHRVNSAGEPGELAKLCPLVVELDLSRNLINSWQGISEITSQLPYLKFMDVSENRLFYNGLNLHKLKSSFPSLKYLVLSRMEYTWDDILNCAVMWPQIEKLQVSFNRITTLKAPPPDIFHGLKLLNVEGNNIIHWENLAQLGYLPSLECLNACNTGLISISIDDRCKTFPSLKYILLSGNFIKEWGSISELDKLPALEELRFRDNPVLEGIQRETARQILIARISKLKILNTQEIPLDERKGAEYDYIKNNGRTWLETTQDPEGRKAFLALHPRYEELIKKYGDIEESEIAVKSTALKSRLIEVKLQSDECLLIKRLPPDMSIQKLVTLAQRLFSTGSVELKLTLHSAKNSELKIPLDNDIKQLSYYSVEEGDIITVEW